MIKIKIDFDSAYLNTYPYIHNTNLMTKNEPNATLPQAYQTDDPDMLVAYVLTNIENPKIQIGQLAKMADIMLILYERNVPIDRYIYDMFINSLIRLIQATWSYHEGTHDNPSIIKYLSKVFKDPAYELTKDQFCSFLSLNYGVSTIRLFISSSKIVTLEKIQAIFKIFEYDNRSNKDQHRDILEKYDNFEVDQKILETACSEGLIKFVEKIITKKILVPTQKCLYNAVSGNSKGAYASIDLCKFLISSGCQLNTECLINACKNRNIGIIEFILQNKIVPTRECFIALFSNDNNDYVRMRRFQRTGKNNNIGSAEPTTKIIDMLASAGYKVTYDDIVLATQNKIFINDYTRFGIKLDEKFMEICAEVGYYPYNLDGIKPTLKCLQKECGKSMAGSLATIKNIINKDGVEPDVICLQNACSHKNNIQLIHFLISKGVSPDIKCLKNIAGILGNRTLTIVLDEYEKSLNKPVKKPRAIKKPAEKTKKVTTKTKNNDSSCSPELNDKNDKKCKKTKDNKNDDSVDSDNSVDSNESVSSNKSVSSSESEKSEDSDESEKSTKNNKKSTSKKTIDVKINEDSENSDSENDLVNFNVTKPDAPIKIIKKGYSIKSIPEKYDFRAKGKQSKSVVDLLSLKKNDEYTFTDIRKEFIKYMNKNKLSDNNSENIKLNKDLISLLKCPETQVFTTDQIDDIVYNLITDDTQTKKTGISK